MEEDEFEADDYYDEDELPIQGDIYEAYYDELDDDYYDEEFD